MAADPDLARIENRQMPIFPRDGTTVCAELRVEPEEARRLFEEGWLSFDPLAGGGLDECREAELVFVGSILASGCTRAMLRQLLAGLRKPYCYDVRRLCWEWRSRSWRLLPGEDDPEAVLFATLERLRDRREHEVLLNLRDWLDEALDLARERTAMFSHFGPLNSGVRAGARGRISR